jgi:arsenical pump membrane protein
MILSGANLLTWCIAGAATAGVIVRPFKWPEAVWAGSGALMLLALGLLPLRDGLKAVGEGLDVYLFLIGMMLLSEVARREGLFDAVAALAVNMGRKAPQAVPALRNLSCPLGVMITWHPRPSWRAPRQRISPVDLFGRMN